MRSMLTGIDSMALLIVMACALILGVVARAGDGVDPIFEKPGPISMAEFAEIALETWLGVRLLFRFDWAVLCPCREAVYFVCKELF